MPFVGGSALLSEQVKVPSGFMPKASYSKNMLRITSLVTWPRISRSSSGKISMITRPQRFPEFSFYRGSLSLSLSHHVSRSFIVVDNSSSCCLDNFLSARLAAQSMTQTFAIWILVGGSPLVYDPSKPSLEGLLDKEYQMNSNEKSSDWLDRSPFFFCGFFLSSSDDSY